MFDYWVRLIAFGGATMGALGSLGLNSWIAILGVVAAFLTLAVNYWHKKKMVEIELERLRREFPIDLDNE